MTGGNLATDLSRVPDGLDDPDAPPSQKLPPGEWLKQNLFSSAFNSLLTIVVGGALVVIGILAAQWIIRSDFQIVRDNIANFMVGRYRETSCGESGPPGTSS